MKLEVSVLSKLVHEAIQNRRLNGPVEGQAWRRSTTQRSITAGGDDEDSRAEDYEYLHGNIMDDGKCSLKIFLMF